EVRDDPLHVAAEVVAALAFHSLVDVLHHNLGVGGLVVGTPGDVVHDTRYRLVLIDVHVRQLVVPDHQLHILGAVPGTAVPGTHAHILGVVDDGLVVAVADDVVQLHAQVGHAAVLLEYPARGVAGRLVVAVGDNADECFRPVGFVEGNAD